MKTKTSKTQKPNNKKSKARLHYNKIAVLIIVLTGLVGVVKVNCGIANLSLQTDVQFLNQEVNALQNDVDNLTLEVKKLDNRARILEIAEENGLEVKQTGIVSVVEDHNAE